MSGAASPGFCFHLSKQKQKQDSPPPPSLFLTARVRKQHPPDQIPHLWVSLAQVNFSHLPSPGEGVSVGSQAWGCLYPDPQTPGSTHLLPGKGMQCLLGSEECPPPPTGVLILPPRGQQESYCTSSWGTRGGGGWLAEGHLPGAWAPVHLSRA